MPLDPVLARLPQRITPTPPPAFLPSFIAAYLIQLFGLFGSEKADWSVQKFVGMAIAIAGVLIFQWERK